MTISNFELAKFSAQIYDDAARSGWDHYLERDNVHVGVVKVQDVHVVAFRGTQEAVDWLRNLDARPEWHDTLGFVHAGFSDGMDDVAAELNCLLGDRVALTGHSLGGARARILAALRIAAGQPVDTLTVFGSPKPGFINVSRIIQKSGMGHISFRNRNDPVPLLPAILPLWKHPESWISLDARPAVNDFDPLRDHSMDLYLQGVKTL